VRCSKEHLNGQFIKWDQQRHVSEKHFKHTGPTITILQTGEYWIFVNYTCMGTGSVELVVSQSISQVHHGHNESQHSKSFCVNHTLLAGEEVKLQYSSDYPFSSDPFSNSFSLILAPKLSRTLKLQNTTKTEINEWINWNVKALVSEGYNVEDNTITVLNSRLYLVQLTYACACSTGHVEVCVNEKVVSKIYHGTSSGYLESFTWEDILPMNPQDTIKVKYTSDEPMIPEDNTCNLLVISSLTSL
jgi:hypothetical protein